MHLKIPYELLLYKEKSDMSVLKIFGCLSFASTITINRNTFDFRSRKYIFLGFKTGVKEYIVLDISTRETFIFRDVIFHEETFIQLDNKDE